MTFHPPAPFQDVLDPYPSIVLLQPSSNLKLNVSISGGGSLVVSLIPHELAIFVSRCMIFLLSPSPLSYLSVPPT